KNNEAVDVYTTLDLHLQRIAQDAVRSGLTHVDELLSRRRRRGKAEAALIAVDPRTGELLAFVGGRSYNQSQYNRAVVARRQPGSVFKPFVYLAAFEQALAEGKTDVTRASIVNDEPETFEFDDQVWTPENYENKYDGPDTLRHALGHPRNLATSRAPQKGGNDLRDAWFVGFTPELLTVVWVGFDDNQPVGLSGAQAALPIWTQFMKAALAGYPDAPFEPPEGITFIDIDPDTGKLAVPGCPRTFREAFLAGTEPTDVCELHRF